MSNGYQFQPISIRDYLEGELHAQRKHEFVCGDVHAVSGGTVQHNRIASNTTVALGGQLRGKPCQVFNSDIKVRVRLSNGTRFYYPDVSIVCQPNEPDNTFQDAPVVIVEVISDSTRRIDEYEKRDAYLSIDSLCVYILIEQTSASALVYRRSDNGFDREVYTGTDTIIPLPEVDCELSLAEVLENVELSD